MALSFPGPARARLDARLRRRAAGRAAAIRLPSDGRRHGSPARAAHDFHHHHRLGAARADGAARTTARAGDVLFVSGTHRRRRAGFGSGAGMPGSRATWGLSQAEAAYLLGRYRRPEPRLALGRGAAPIRLGGHGRVRRPRQGPATGCCGLRASAGRLARATCRCRTRPARSLARAPERLTRFITAGDDYEVLAAVSTVQCRSLRGCSTRRRRPREPDRGGAAGPLSLDDHRP